MKILYEGRQRGTLYRMIDIRGMLEILEDDTCSSQYYDKISFTRDKNMTNYVGMKPRSIFQLIVNGDALTNNYKIRPYADPTEGDYGIEYRSEEHEEQVQARTIKGISKFIQGVNIVINTGDFSWWWYETPDDNKTFTSPYKIADARQIIREVDKRFGIKAVIIDGEKSSLDELKEVNLY